MNLSQWRRFFEDRGVAPQFIDEYQKYIKVLLDSDQPVIFELDHLSALLGINLDSLAKIVSSPENFYREFTIPKRSGGKRLIVAPYESLLTCQKWILRNILNKISIHQSAHGFCQNRSIKTNAYAHIQGTAFLKMDLRDFFPSISKNWIIKIFQDIGYAPNVAFYLASICCYNDALAQGAATSPALSNIALQSLDNRLTRLAKKCSLTYTRYADDLTFSGKTIHVSFQKIVAKIVEQYGLVTNHDKTRLNKKGTAKIVTGISILKNQLAVPRKYKRDLRNEIFFIEKFGLPSHLSNRRIRNPYYLNSLLGRITFWLHIEPTNHHAIEARKLVLDLMST